MPISPCVAAPRAAVVLLAALACRRTTDAPSVVQVADSAGVRITTVTADPAALAEWRVAEAPVLTIAGAGEGDSAAFGQVGSVRWLASGELVVADVMSKRLLVFDAAGRFLRAHGGEGDGPAELRAVGSVTPLAADSFAVFDPARRRLGVWHAEGGFARAVQLPDPGTLESWAMDGWAWRDTALVVLQLSTGDLAERPQPGGEPRRWTLRARVTVHDATGAVVGASPAFDAQYTAVYADGDTRAPFSHRPFAAVAPSRILFGSGDAFTVRALDERLAVAGEVRWPAHREPLAPAEAESVQAAVVARVAPGASSPPPRLQASLARSFAPAVLPRERPAINRVLVAEDGRLWVERFEPERLGSALPPASDRWTVLEPDGRPVARLRLPPGARLEAVRGDRVALVVHDELDVQRVAVFELRTGGR